MVIDVEPGRRLAWDTTSSGARWIWELIPTGLGRTSCTPAPYLAGYVADAVVRRALLGGAATHTDDLEQDMAGSVRRLKEVVERAT